LQHLEEALEMFGVTNVGRTREHNEDQIAMVPALGLALVADGMGGYNAGEVASAMAAEIISTEIGKVLPTLVANQKDAETGLRYETLVLRDAISRANGEIYKAARATDSYRGMGTTIAAVLFFNNRATVAHVGDSRVYRLRGDKFRQLTVDHSVVQEELDRSTLSEEEAREAFQSNLVTRALGVERRTAMDLSERRARPGDLFLLCSDGLTNMVTDGEIAAILTEKAKTLEDAAGRLVQQANRRGGKDNISVVLVRVMKDFAAEEDWQARVLDVFAPR